MEGGSPTVLVVDDEPDVVAVYELALEAYDVRTATSGQAALDELDEAVDVVLLDRRMPGLSGEDVLEEIRDRDLDARVAMVTAVDPDFDIVDMPFDAYLTKPVADEDVRRAVEELVALSSYDDSQVELFSVAARVAALENARSDRELAESDEYRALVERRDELDAEVLEAVDGMDRETFEKAMAGLSQADRD